MSWGYDPIAVLMEEHQVFLRRLREARRVLGSVPADEPARSVARSSAADFARFLAEDVDAFHGRKEEEALFPALARHMETDGGPVGVMLEDHATLREHQSTLARDAGRLERDLDSAEAWSGIRAATGSVDELLRFHIDKEDRVLFPMAREILSPGEMREVTEICRQIEQRLDSARRT